MLRLQGSEVLEIEQGPRQACDYYRIGYVLRVARRSKDWNEGLAQDLQDARFARAFLIAAVDDGVPLKEALAKVIRAGGVKEFAEKVGMASPNVLRAIDPRHNPTLETLGKLLAPLGLRLGLAPAIKTRAGRVKRRTKLARASSGS
jgi:DNA-binding phage protein